ncbi:MAG: hypothetical protein KA765_18370, partial [Thermoflexales bacterium]|nr:hypothetical protein [Thermoflexales bacterium]
MRSGRTFFVLLTVLSFALLSGQPALAAAGTLDCRFGNNFGLASAMPSGVSGFQGGKAIAMYAGGTYADQLVMAGMSGNYPAQNGIVARFTADGLLDTTFNTTGFSAVFDSGGDDIFMAVAAQDDGKIMVAGQAKATGDTYNKILVARYTSDGALDTSFSGDGWLTEAIGSSDSFWYDVVTDASGNIFVAGRSTVNPVGSWNHLATIVKYNSSGVRQAIWTYDLGTGVGNGNEGFYQIVPAGSGRFYAAGFSYNGTWDQNAIVYINSDGTLNTAFDGDGKKTFILSGVGSEYLYALGLQSDGKIVAAGTADTDSNPIAYTWTSFTVRLNADGTFDT